MFTGRSIKQFGGALLAAASLTVAGCAADDGDTLAVSCEGKCDGLSSVKSLLADWKKLDVGDLVSVGAGFATDALNDQLVAGDYNRMSLAPTSLYGTTATANSDATIADLNALVAGLAARFGETSLSTEANRVRLATLQSQPDAVFAESAFRVAAGLGHNWNVATRGFGSDATANAVLGFLANVEIEARVVSLQKSEFRAHTGAPLAAIKAARGFVFARSIADLKAMKPGESFALSGEGKLGINVGAGVPVLLANPGRVIGYELVLSAALRAQLEGKLDIAAVRLPNDSIVVDVGMLTSKVNAAQIALTGGFGVHGLVQRTATIGGKEVDLGKLLDKALTKTLNSKFKLLEASAGTSQTSARMSVARLRFSLTGADASGARDQALAQALRGDIRLAQALAARGDAGVVADFDLVRSGVSTTTNAGVEMLGMRFFKEQRISEGDAVVQTPGGALAVMWNTLHRASGWFFSSHGYARTGLAGVMFDARKPGPARGEANLFISTVEGDKFLERDKAMDQFDSVIVALAGMNALRAVERKGNELARYVAAICPLPPSGEFFDETCNVRVLESDSQAQALRSGALNELDAATSALAPDTRELVRHLADLRLAAQSVIDPQAAAVNPSASLIVDYRIDDAGLKAMMGKDKTAFAATLTNLMSATQVDRNSDVAPQRERIASSIKAQADAMASIYDTYAQKYERLADVEGAQIEGVGKIGANTVEVRFTVDTNNAVNYDSAVARSVAQARSEVATGLFDALRDAAANLPTTGDRSTAHPEQVAAFTLLALTPANKTDLRVVFKTDNGSRQRYNTAGYSSFDMFVHGRDASLIGAGMFDINSIIKTEE